MITLSKQELDHYRQKLAGLEVKTRADGGSINDCKPHIWQTFNPKAKIGQQVYTSFSDEELLNLLIRTMDHPGHKPRFEEIHFIYRKYICLHFEVIHNLYEFDCGELSGWMYKVNEWFPNYGCSRYQLQEGDIICWEYTCDLGVDVGGFYSVGG